jgi:dTDP-L-rhamnose 4-epimerase
MSNKILITGGAGFIGSRLAKKLFEKGYPVIILDTLAPQIHGENATFPNSLLAIAECIQGDILDKDIWKKIPTDISFVFHLAAETGTGQSMYEISRYVEVNVQGTARLLEFIQGRGNEIKKIILSSSRAVYGEGAYFCKKHGNVYPFEREEQDLKNGFFELRCPICNTEAKMISTSEDSKLHPQSIYGVTKLSQEQLVQTSAKAMGIPYSILRFQNVYGPGQSLSNPYTGILSIFSTRIRNGKGILVFEDGKESRDFVFVDDVVDALILCLENKEANDMVFNVGGGEVTSVLGLAESLLKMYDVNVSIEISGNYRIGDIRHNLADISMIQKIGYKPKYPLEKGLHFFVDWVLSQEIQKDQSDHALEELKSKNLFN